MGQRKQYTRQSKLEAVELHRSSGKSATKLEHALGLYPGQLHAEKRKLK